jgi:hypothetical protein
MMLLHPVDAEGMGKVSVYAWKRKHFDRNLTGKKPCPQGFFVL